MPPRDRSPRRLPSDAVERPAMPANPAPVPTADTRPVRRGRPANTKRFTVDLDPERHRFFATWQFESELEGAPLFKALLDLVRDDPSVRVRAEAHAASLVTPRGPRRTEDPGYGPPEDPISQWTQGGSHSTPSTGPTAAPRPRR